MERLFSFEPLLNPPGRGRVRCRLLSLMLTLLLLSIVPVDVERASANEPLFLASQAVSAYPGVEVYLDVADSSGRALTPPEPGVLKAVAEGREIPVRSVRPFADTNQGVGYIFLADISRSLGESELAGMRKAISSWVNSCGKRDSFALVSFGSDVHVLQDFTPDKGDFLDRVGGLHPTDMLTSLHGALLEAQRLGKRQDPGLPARRVVIVLSDGKNESLYGETAREVLRDLREASAPIFALGYYHPPVEGKKEHLRQLALFARASGGAYFRPGDDGLGAVFDSLRSRIDNTWVVDLDMKDITPRGQSLRVEVGFPWQGGLLSDAFDVRLMPPVLALAPAAEGNSETGLTSPEGTPEASGASEPNSPKEEETPVGADDGESSLAAGDQTSPSDEKKGLSPMLLGGAFLFLLGLFLLGGLVRKAGPKNGGIPDREASVQEHEDLPAVEPSELRLRLEVIRGRRVARSFRLLLSGSRILGRSEESDISIVDDRTVSGRHCELVLQEGGLAVRDLDSTNGTFVNNRQISELTAVKDGDMLRLGQTSIRFIFEEDHEPAGGTH